MGAENADEDVTEAGWKIVVVLMFLDVRWDDIKKRCRGIEVIQEKVGSGGGETNDIKRPGWAWCLHMACYYPERRDCRTKLNPAIMAVAERP